MRVIEKTVRVRLAQTPDATLAEAYFTDPIWDNAPPSEAAIRHGVAKRHHTDPDDPALGEALAMARALQGVVDGLWVNVKAACPDVVTPKERAAAKGYARGVADGMQASIPGPGNAEAVGAESSAWRQRGAVFHVPKADPGPMGPGRAQSFSQMLSDWSRLRP